MNFSQKLSKFLSYGCWVVIILISITYFISTTSSGGNKYVAGKYRNAPSVDPVIYTEHAIFRAPKVMTRERIKIFRNMHKNAVLYSWVNRDSYSNVSYRPDFKNYPVITLMVLFCRLITYIGIVFFFFLLANILKSVSLGNIFNPKNYKRLFYMGFILTVLPIIRTLHSTVLASQVKYDPGLLAWIIEPAYSYLWLCLIGVVILIFSFVFKEATRLYEEQKLTV